LAFGKVGGNRQIGGEITLDKSAAFTKRAGTEEKFRVKPSKNVTLALPVEPFDM
jgi:hypothetical protein